MFHPSSLRAVIAGAAAVLLSGAALAVPPTCDDPALAASLKAFVENNIPEIKAAGMTVKEVRAFAEVSYDQAADTRVCKAEAELANAQILDLTVSFSLNPETGGYVPKVEYVPRP